MAATDPIPVPAYGVFHRGASRSLLRVATIDPSERQLAGWPDALSRLRASGATTVRVVVPWTRHARSPGVVCLDGSDGHTPDAMGVLRLSVEIGLDVWVDAGPIAHGVPTWAVRALPSARAVDSGGRPTGRVATGDPGFRAEAALWARGVARAAVQATGVRVAIWTLDGRAEPHGIPVDHSPVTVATFRQWLRDRYEDDRALAREWLQPGLRIDEAMPPLIAQPSEASHSRALKDALGAVRRVATWARRRLGAVANRDLRWPDAIAGPGPRRTLPLASVGRAPGQLADWHAFSIDAWQDYLAAMRSAVEADLPGVTFVADEMGRVAIPGAGTTARHAGARVAVPVLRVRPQVHDAGWAATSLVARTGDDLPVMVAMQSSGRGAPLVAAAISAIAEGAVVIDLPEASFVDPEVRRLARWIGEVEDQLTASTRLDDRVAWFDDPAHGGADSDDLDGVASRGIVDRGPSASAYAAIREAGLAPVVVDPSTFVADEATDLGALVVPTRRWIDLDRYGSLVVHVLRGGNLVALPHAPGRQRDGTTFRSTFLWPSEIAAGGRVQVHDGTSCLVPDVTSVDGRGGWVEAIIEDVSPRFRVAAGMRMSITARLLPDGACLVFFVNPTQSRQSGSVGVPDPVALGLGDGFIVEAAFATSGASACRDEAGLSVDVPPGGAVVARLSDCDG